MAEWALALPDPRTPEGMSVGSSQVPFPAVPLGLAPADGWLDVWSFPPSLCSAFLGI